MNRIEKLNRRYAAVSAVSQGGVDIVVVADPPGAILNTAVQRLLEVAGRDLTGTWENLVGASKALRWRRLTQPQPTQFNSLIEDAVTHVVRLAKQLRGAVADDDVLDELAAAAGGLSASESEIGRFLLQSLEETDGDARVVVAANRSAQVGLARWLAGYGAPTFTVGDIAGRDLGERAYVVGPPRFYPASLVTAPTTTAISFVTPGWFGDRSVPRSAIAKYAEGAIRPEPRILIVGDVGEVESGSTQSGFDEEFLPEPSWGTRSSPEREPTSSEVEAVKVLLSGNLAVWLDDGDRIRAIDPTQPAGERVTYTDVGAVRRGTYLLLKQGESEHGALYDAALRLLGERAEAIAMSQQEWKRRLSERIDRLGYATVVRQLRVAGVQAADRARAWAEPVLMRPASDVGFERLLQWLDMPIQPTFGNATLLRKMIYQASADIREQLESAVGEADLSILEQTGHMSLDVQEEGLRGIVATRVLAISPFTEIVARYDARVPFEDESGQWLE